jgi:hypothetical protein
MPTIITLLPTLYNISILYASVSRYRGPNKVVSSTSAWSHRALRDLCRTKLRGRRARSSAERSLGGDVHGAVTLVERGSILIFQTILAVSLTRKAVVADRHNYADRYNPITYVSKTRLEKLLINH